MTLGATALALGALSGFRHAFDPDHLAAVSTLVSERPQPLRAAHLGAWWGVGHTAALAGVGTILAVLGRSLPPRLQETFEFAVAIMLLILGARAIRRAWMNDGHGGQPGERRWFSLHQHSGLQAHVHVGPRTIAVRPLAIGMLHGLAGSGALTALAMSSLPSPSMRIAYALLFGIASSVGMALVSGLAGLSIARLSRSDRSVRTISLATGLLSMSVSGLWGLPILIGWLGPR